MKHIRKISIALTFLFSLIASANDGVYYASGGPLIPIHETDISVAKEILTISLCDDGLARVDVQYEFINHGAAKTVDMGFEAANPYNSDDDGVNPTGGHPYIYDFMVEMNGMQLPYRNAVVEPGELETPYQGPKDENEEFEQFSYAYLFKAPFKEGMNKVHHTYSYNMSYGVGRTFEVLYWLTPAARWKGGTIGDFTLRIHAEKTAKHFLVNDSVLNLAECRIVEGVGKTRHTQYSWGDEMLEVALRNGTAEWHITDFRPEADLVIMSADTFCSFDENAPIGFFYDRSELFYFWRNMDKKIPEHIARNLPYANRGYVFKKKELRDYFSQFFWYMPDPSYVPSTDDFTPREWRLIKEHQ